MAKTFTKAGLGFALPADSYLEYLIQYGPEAATQTFVATAPVVWASGFVSTAANPVTAIMGFALNAAQNGTAGQYTQRFIPTYAGLKVFANFLGSAAADNVLAASDLGLSTVQLGLSSTLVNGTSPGWYFIDTGGSSAIKITSFESDQRVPNVSEVIAVAGDTNARVTGEILTAINQYLV